MPGPSLYEKLRHFARRKWFWLSHDPSAESVRIRRYGIAFQLPHRFVNHYVFHDYEPVTRKFLLGAVRPGMTVADVGAHIGFYTVLAAKRAGEGGRVIAVEPSEDNLGCLRENLTLNGLGNVEVHPVAVGARREERAFHLTGSSDSHGFYPHPLTETVKEIRVQCVPIDEIVPGRVDLLKIDVEGAELEALEGMQRTLASNPRLTLCIEWNPACMRNAGYDPMGLPQQLQSLGFQTIRVLDDTENRVLRLEDALEVVRSGAAPDYWYVNLWAERAG
jgi:FkbM family methyltransferase